MVPHSLSELSWITKCFCLAGGCTWVTGVMLEICDKVNGDSDSRIAVDKGVDECEVGTSGNLGLMDMKDKCEGLPWFCT